MAIDTSKKRRASAAFGAVPINTGVTPDLTPDTFYHYALLNNYFTLGVGPVGSGGRTSRYRLQHRARTVSRGT